MTRPPEKWQDNVATPLLADRGQLRKLLIFLPVRPLGKKRKGILRD